MDGSGRSAAARRARAEARHARATLHRTDLATGEAELSPTFGAEAVSLVTRLTRESWALSGQPLPDYTREETPCRFVPGRLT